MENTNACIGLALAHVKAIIRMVESAETTADVEALPAILPDYLKALEAVLYAAQRDA